MAQRLFEDQAGAVNAPLSSGTFIHRGGGLTVFVWGTFAGSNIKIQFSPDGIEWFDDPTQELFFESKTLKTVVFSQGIHVKAVLSDVSSGTLINTMVMN